MTHRTITSDQRGFALIEVIVAAVVLATVALALLAGLDGALGSVGREKARATASTVAEQDQERMRAMPVTALSNYRAKRIVGVGGAAYTVVSRADWIRDADGGSDNCTSATTAGDYLKISSTVTSEVVGSRTRPVAVSSLVAPPVGAFGKDRGTLAVKIIDRDDVGVPGQSVTIDGPVISSDATNSVGCAVFGYVPVGSYEVRINVPGYVDDKGVTAVKRSGTVTTGNVNLVTIRYDRAARLQATFDTLPAGAAAAQASAADALRLENAAAPGPLSFTAQAPPATTDTGFTLFPFKDGYSTYSGKCSESDPGKQGVNATVVLAPGEDKAVTIRQPALNVTVKRDVSGTWTPEANARVVTTLQTTSGCTDRHVLTTAANGRVTRPSPSPFDPGLPFGVYTVCATSGVQRGQITVANDRLTGSVAKDLKLNGVGVCP